MQEKAVVYLIPFAHLDLFWAGSREECLSRGAEVILTALCLLETYPDYRFMIEAVNFLEYFKEAYPDDFQRVEKFVKSGRLEVIPVRAILYTQLPSGETLVRNYLSGRESCEKWFGFSGKTASLSDIPGVTPQLPQIARKSGFTALLLSHGTPPHTDRVCYTAPDGTEIARGLVNYDSSQLRLIAGKHCEEFAAILGFSGPEEAVHRDNMVMIAGKDNQAP